VIDAPGAADHGLVARDPDGRALAFDRIERRLVPAEGDAVRPALKGRYALPDGHEAVPVFELLARRCLDPAHSPDAVAARTGIAAATIRRIAAELAAAALDDPPEIAVPWTDVWGHRHRTMPGRPVAIHAMRGISAHSNGFQTARAIHVLQLLLGTIDAPGGFRFKSPYPKTVPPGPRPCGRPDQVEPGKPLPGMPLGYPQGPEDLIVAPDGTPARIDKAFSWEAPLAVHGMMHTVIGNAWRGDPYPIDVLFMYMANMAWNSAMSTEKTIAMLTDVDQTTGEYRIPRIIYSDAFYSETVAYADLILPDTTYLERHDCISLLDRPIGSADAIADAIRQPVLPPRHDVRPFQDVLIELGWRLGLPAFTRADGTARYPGLYPDYMVNHERAPGIGPLAGWRGPDGEAVGKGSPNPDQLERYKAHGCFFEHPFAPAQRYFKQINRDYQELAVATGMMAEIGPVTSRLYVEVLQRFRLAAQGHGAHVPPEPHRARLALYADPLPFWYPPFEATEPADASAETGFPLHAVTQRPMAMYHSWGSMNPWLRQIHGENRLYMARATAARLGVVDGGWVWVESRHGRIKAQVRLMDGVNPDTVWTWNAIGKRAGAWALDPRSAEVTRGFLLNHLIDELLPERDSGYRYANADPITGQAAWYDLKVRVLPADPVEAGETAPLLPPIGRPPGLARPPATIRWSTAR
jgi:anaerobic selenocysteine-containing dehydrogenase